MKKEIFKTEKGNITYWISEERYDGPFLVFLPGLTADHRLFEKQVEYFSGKRNIIVWDGPGHNESRPFELTFSMRDTAAYLDGIFLKENVKSHILIGQSLGGYIAQVYMDMYSGKTSGFISIDSCPLTLKYYSGGELRMLKHTRLMYQSIPWETLKKWGSSGNSETEYGRKLMLDMMESYTKEEYIDLAVAGFRMLAEEIEFKPVRKLECPVLLICGEKDKAGAARSYNKKWEKEGHRLVWLKDAGHNSNTDKPDEVNALIDEFLRRHT